MRGCRGCAPAAPFGPRPCAKERGEADRVRSTATQAPLARNATGCAESTASIFLGPRRGAAPRMCFGLRPTLLWLITPESFKEVHSIMPFQAFCLGPAQQFPGISWVLECLESWRAHSKTIPSFTSRFLSATRPFTAGQTFSEGPSMVFSSPWSIHHSAQPQPRQR